MQKVLEKRVDGSSSKLILHMKRVALCSNIYIKHTNALCERNVEFFNVSGMQGGMKTSFHPAYQSAIHTE